MLTISLGFHSVHLSSQPSITVITSLAKMSERKIDILVPEVIY